jgi:general L-amino acid transport system substrate-binding protein
MLGAALLCLGVGAAAPARGQPAGGPVASPPADAATAQGGGVAAIRARGQLVCGVGAASPGFAVQDARGWRGIDVDYCRAVASVLLGDPARLRIVVTTAERGYAMLASGEVDMLARSATWTLEREAGLGVAFPIVSYYDGQGFLVHRNGGIGSMRQLDGATVCVGAGTTTEQNLGEWARAMRLRVNALALDYREAVAAFLGRRCDALTGDSSALGAVRAAQGGNAERFALLPELISKEPLGPLLRKGDWPLFDILRWTHFALLTAEELGVSSSSIEEARGSPSPDVQRLFGRVGQSGRLLGLEPDWAARLVRQVGNYGEVWERNIAPLGLPRGLNLLWLHGGLHYAPPMR